MQSLLKRFRIFISPSRLFQQQTRTMTTADFKYIDPSSLSDGAKPWGKVDADYASYKQLWQKRSVHDLRDEVKSGNFSTDTSGFSVHQSPSSEKAFTDDSAVRGGYYSEIESALHSHLPDGKNIKKVVIFDHTIRRRTKDAARTPVQQVHVDQTAGAAEARVRRHLPREEAEELLKGRFQIVNVWRPIENAASDHPLAVIDWRTTEPADFVPIDLLYPKRADSVADGDDDRGKEIRPDDSTWTSLEGYEVRGETFGVKPSPKHKFYYVKDMTPDELLFLKCYDSFGEGQTCGRNGIAVRTPHTAFADPNTPQDAPPRQSIEVRCLVFYE